jgi:hypothetical protein
MQDMTFGYKQKNGTVTNEVEFTACHLCMGVLRQVMQKNDKYLLCLYLDGVCDFATRMMDK